MAWFERCQDGREWGPESQCQLEKGHSGNHRNHYAIVNERHAEANPTLSAIRQVVKEEVRAALKEKFPENPKS